MELVCVECGIAVNRAGSRGPLPRFCPEHVRLRRNASRRARYAENRTAEIAAVREWQRLNPERKKATAAAWHAANRTQQSERRRRWAEANPSRDSAAHRLRTYGLTQVQYDDMARAQGMACRICLDIPADPLVVDHDHACCAGARSCGQCIRGLLCRRCNAGLGLFGDDPFTLRRAFDYLLRRVAA